MSPESHLSWPGAPGSGRCRGSEGSRGRKEEEPSEVQSAKQLYPTGLATGPHCPVTPPDPGPAQGEGSDSKIRLSQNIHISTWWFTMKVLITLRHFLTNTWHKFRRHCLKKKGFIICAIIYLRYENASDNSQLVQRAQCPAQTCRSYLTHVHGCQGWC